MRTVPLGEVATIISGATPNTGIDDYWGGDVQWATPADLSKLDGPYISKTPRTLTSAGVRSCATTVLPAGSVLLSSRAPIGHVAINTVPMATNQGFKSLVPTAAVEAKYLYHWLKSNTDYLRSLGNGATFKELSTTTSQRIMVPLPPVPEQRRIAAILDHADALRAKRRQVLTHLDALTQSIFHDMFDTEERSQAFATVCTRLTVGVVVKPASHYVTNGVPALRTLNVKPGLIELNDLVYFSKESNDGPLAKSKLRSGDLVIARTGNAGTAAVVPAALDGANAIDLIVATPDQRVALPVYLEALLNSDFGKRLVRGEARGQIQQHFNVGSLKNASIPVPLLDRQTAFSDRISLITEQRERLLKAVKADDELFASLQARAFDGRL